MKMKRLAFSELQNELEVLEMNNLRAIKGGLTAGELLAGIALHGVDNYVGDYHFANGGGSDATGYSFNQSNMAPLIMAGLNFGGGGSSAIFGGDTK